MADHPWKQAEEELLERVIAVQRLEMTMESGAAVPLVPDAVWNFRLALTAETDRGCALHAASHLDDELHSLLRSAFVDDERAAEAILENSGAIGSFSARTDLAYLLGLVSRKTKRELDLIRKVRNEFAHHAGHLRFSHGPIASRCHELTYQFGDAPSPRARFCTSVIAVLALLHAAKARVERRVQPPDPDADAWRAQVEALRGTTKQADEGVED